MMQTFESFIDILNDYLYSFLLTGTLVCCSIYFTVRSRCLQLRMFGEMCHLLVHREPTPNRHHCGKEGKIQPKEQPGGGFHAQSH